MDMYQNDTSQQQAKAYNDAISAQGRMTIGSSGPAGIAGSLGAHTTNIAVGKSLYPGNTVISMEVHNAVNGYVVRINGETFIAHTPADISDLILKRLAISNLEKE
jgi:hypothetical protein